MKTGWVRVSLIYFFIIALLGILMRIGFFNGYFPVDYKYLLHTHSHIAFLGWIYPVLFIAIVNNFLTKEQVIKGKYHLQFIITQIIIAGMLISFLLQGYGLFSIIFSSVFQIMTYWFAFQLFKDWKKDSLKYSLKFIKTGLIVLVISSMGTWSLAVIGAKGLAGSDIYNLAIYFYLHFQYNGWFSFAVLGMLFGLIEKNYINFSQKYASLSYKLLSFSLFPAYLLSALDKIENISLIFIAAFAGIIQLAGTVYLLLLLFRNRKEISCLFQGFIKPLMLISAVSFLLKNVLQLISVLPSMTDLAFNNRYVVIAYIHMVFIGFISFFLFGYLAYLGWYNLKSKLAKTGVALLVTGYSVTELLLIAPALKIFVPNLSMLILVFSLLMGIGLTFFIVAQFSFKNIGSSNEALIYTRIPLKKMVKL